MDEDVEVFLLCSTWLIRGEDAEGSEGAVDRGWERGTEFRE